MNWTDIYKQMCENLEKTINVLPYEKKVKITFECEDENDIFFEIKMELIGTKERTRERKTTIWGFIPTIKTLLQDIELLYRRYESSLEKENSNEQTED